LFTVIDRIKPAIHPFQDGGYEVKRL